MKSQKNMHLVKALIIKPKERVKLEEISLEKKSSNEELVTWEVSSVCNSERRRYNLTKSKDDSLAFIGGHEAVGFIEDEKYINRRYALLPHSNCLTRGEENPCKNCTEGKENLCIGMVHAGLDKDTPSGFTEKMFVDRSQLFDVTEVDNGLAPFLEPLSCVIRSWKLAKTAIQENDNLRIGIIGGGPIGCLHALYSRKLNPTSDIFLIEKDHKKRSVLNEMFRDLENISIVSNDFEGNCDISVMASSDSSAYSEAERVLNEDGHLILFSGFNEVNYDDGYLPEVVHRNEFIHHANNKILIGSSGYTSEDLIAAKLTLLDFSECHKIITGKAYGLDAKTIYRHDGTIEHYDEQVLVLDIKGELDNHIKVQYFNNSNYPS